MKTFAEFLPTLTARERKIVEAFQLAMEAWHDDDNPKTDWPLEIMRSTPPANEPESVIGEAIAEGDKWTTFYFVDKIPNVRNGDRVRVTKIEGAQ